MKKTLIGAVSGLILATVGFSAVPVSATGFQSMYYTCWVECNKNWNTTTSSETVFISYLSAALGNMEKVCEYSGGQVVGSGCYAN